MTTVAILPAAPTDAAGIAAIYNHYITNTLVTFEEEAVAPAEIARRIEEIAKDSLPWLVARNDDEVVGYAYATRWKSRYGYRFAVEITVYLSPEHTGLGIGSMLYGELFSLLEARGIHAVIGGIALPNDASVALHEKFGMKKVAHFIQPGIKFGQWVDVGYWERVLQQV